MSDSPQLPAVPEVRCPGCLILMRVVAVQNTPEQRLTLTYHCDRCGADTKRSFFQAIPSSIFNASGVTSVTGPRDRQ
jgi:hypothetical protein